MAQQRIVRRLVAPHLIGAGTVARAEKADEQHVS
jgi:hypothetical protein